MDACSTPSGSDEPAKRIAHVERATVKLSRSRLWLFRCLAIVLGLSPLVVLEVGLRVLGIGADLTLVVPWRGSLGWYQLNPKFDQPFYGRSDLSGPEGRPFRLPKPAGTRRVLVVGGSTVVGFPYPSELAFPRQIQELLQAQADAGETIEVLNAGITAMNSSSEVAVVEEGLRVQPDAIVVYTGHNEFYGPGGVASSAGQIDSNWFRRIARWRRLYLVQAVSRLMQSRTQPSDLIESLPGDLHIPLDSDTFQRANRRFEQNLSEMAKLAAAARVPILFVSPVANERDQPPIENINPAERSAEEEARHRKQLVVEWQAQFGDAAQAIEKLERLRVERDGDPNIRFRLAQGYERAGRTSEAVEQFQAALDLDGCRFRAPSAFRATVQSVAARHAAGRASFMDLHAVVCQADAISALGRKHLLEHVHFTWEGNRATADAISRGLWRQAWSREWVEAKSLDDESLRTRMAVQPEDDLAALALAMMIYARPPFRDGVDATKLAQRLADDSVKEFQRLTKDRQQLFETMTPANMTGALLDSMIAAARTSVDDEQLGHWLRARVVRQPWRADARNELARWLDQHGSPEEAAHTRAAAANWE